MSNRPEPRPPTITEEIYLAVIKTHVARIEALEAALRDIQRYSVGDPRPRHTWYYDRAEEALAPEPDK